MANVCWRGNSGVRIRTAFCSMVAELVWQVAWRYPYRNRTQQGIYSDYVDDSSQYRVVRDYQSVPKIASQPEMIFGIPYQKLFILL